MSRQPEPSPNRILWRFNDATVPTEWKSKQAERIYAAAMDGERDGSWAKYAVGGSVRIATHKNRGLELFEPSYSYRAPDDLITVTLHHHIARLHQHADRLEKVLAAYGPSAFRTQRAAIPAPLHPFDAEEAILSVISRSDVDELWVHGRHFVRDESRAFVREAE